MQSFQYLTWTIHAVVFLPIFVYRFCCFSVCPLCWQCSYRLLYLVILCSFCISLESLNCGIYFLFLFPSLVHHKHFLCPLIHLSEFLPCPMVRSISQGGLSRSIKITYNILKVLSHHMNKNSSLFAILFILILLLDFVLRHKSFPKSIEKMAYLPEIL